MSIQNCRIVLVRPQVAANLGATARVMRNMGLSNLVLVAPRHRVVVAHVVEGVVEVEAQLRRQVVEVLRAPLFGDRHSR